MQKSYFVIGGVSVILLLVLMIGIISVSYSNKEIQLRNLITAKMKDNTSEFDNLWKKINQVSKVAIKDRELLKDIFNSYASARTPQGGDAPLMRWVQESVPNVNQSTFANLQNTIISSRDNWTMRQKELIDYKREHDNIRLMFPSSLFVGSRPEIQVTIITSTKTEETFKKGKDDNTDIF